MIMVNISSGMILILWSLPVDKKRYYMFLCLVISLVIGLIYASGLKAAMKNVAKKSKAAQYIEEGSLTIGRGVDRFLYSKTEKKDVSKEKS